VDRELNSLVAPQGRLLAVHEYRSLRTAKMWRVGKSPLRGAVALQNERCRCRATLIRSLAALFRENRFPVIENSLPVHAMNRKVTFAPLSCSKRARICGLGWRFCWKSPCYERENAENSLFWQLPLHFSLGLWSLSGDRFALDCLLSHAPQ
jgi:hypothetical protein